ncbi:MAG: tRNA (N6-threonylcarbamoyladenosine(37)-N6)-methyltransferase TrmO [Chloroflexi bacterium]|nr:tRNA (N6-threonylcarbamoyladenosine(37)-N6)-methyltransferase TrmO [Chloroflexota bacterium]
MGSDASVFEVTPIGFVRSRFTTYAPSSEMREHLSEIVVLPEFADGLLGLETGDQILTLFVLHRAAATGYELRLHPGHNPANPIRGVFSTRSQYRPNFIAATIAQIQDISEVDEGGGAIITVVGLDAQDGSPVIDIKRHSAGFDGNAP